MRAKFPQFDRPSPGRGHPIAYGPVIACAIARHADKVTSTSAVGSSSRRHQLIGRLRDQVLARVRWRRIDQRRGWTRAGRLPPRLQARARHSVEAEGLALSFRPLAGLAQDEEPDLRGGEAGGEGQASR
jgi:hypothetical protein